MKLFLKVMNDLDAFFELYFLKILPFTLDEIMEYIKVNNLESTFVDQFLNLRSDGGYLLSNQSTGTYSFIQVDRGEIIVNEKFESLRDALRVKIKYRVYFNASTFTV